MTDEQINERIALLCGWKIFSHWYNLWAPPRRVVEYECDAYPIPNYIRDLNACHEFEKTLTEKEAGAFHDQLEIAMNRDDATDCPASEFWYHATARQRCEAFLRVHGQWEEQL